LFYYLLSTCKVTAKNRDTETNTTIFPLLVAEFDLGQTKALLSFHPVVPVRGDSPPYSSASYAVLLPLLFEHFTLPPLGINYFFLA
jgi:hypothetical protein